MWMGVWGVMEKSGPLEGPIGWLLRQFWNEWATSRLMPADSVH